VDGNLLDFLGGPAIEQGGEGVSLGALFYAPVPYVANKFSVIRPGSYDPVAVDSARYRVREVKINQLCMNLPHKELGIRSCEDLLVTVVTRRPVVALTLPLTKGDGKGFPSHFRDTVLCAPLYTIVDEDNAIKQTYNARVVHEIAALKYREVFPIPSRPLKAVMSALRLDRVQPFHVDALVPVELRLTRKWVAYVRDWVQFYAMGRLGASSAKGEKRIALLGAARDLLMEAVGRAFAK
jgi:hypothetical protein